MNHSNTKRLAQLDFLRAFAVLLVVGNHLKICPPEISLSLNQLTSVWNRGGWTGVDLFFVLSGFLIAGLLFGEYAKSGDINIKRFLVRRGFKIYPAFWFLILATLAITVFSREQIYRGGFLDEFLFVQNYEPSIWEHTWSLAVEEHFYIFLSVLFFALTAAKRRCEDDPFAAIPRLFVVIAVVCFAFRLATARLVPFQYGTHICQTHLRIDSLFFGVALAYFWHFRGLSGSEFLDRNKFLIGVTGAACLMPAFIFDLGATPWLPVAGLTLFYLGSGLLLLAFLKTNLKNDGLPRRFARLGKYSYTIYLWNLPVHFWLTKFTALPDENWFIYAFLYFSLTLALGVGTAKLIEQPVLRVRERFFPSTVAILKPA